MVSTERKWLLVTPQFLITNGAVNGVVEVPDSSLFRVKQKVRLKSLTQPLTPENELEIKRITSPTQMIVGPGSDITSRANLSAFLTADNATIEAPEQFRPSIDPVNVLRSAYEEEPIMAHRSLLVDKFGRPYDVNNPIPSTAFIDGDVYVQLDGFDLSDPDSVQVTGTETGSKAGVKHSLRVDSDIDLRVGISDGANKAEVDATRRLSVKDVAAQTILTNILSQLASGTTKVDDDATQALLTSILGQLQSGGFIIGTEDGTITGTPHVFVNNLRKMIMETQDRVGTITWLDIADKKNRRVDKLEYTSATFPGITVRKQFSYSLVGNEYVRTSPGTWSIV